jgi:hypothetical protein
MSRATKKRVEQDSDLQFFSSRPINPYGYLISKLMVNFEFKFIKILAMPSP